MTRHLLRIVLGAVFVCSSLMKVVGIHSFADTVNQFCGFLGFDWLYGYGLPLAIGVCAGELALGGLLLAGWYERCVSLVLVLVMVFFTVITLLNYIDPYGGIESCGCFGELIHFTPRSALSKNIALLLAAVALLCLNIKKKKVENLPYSINLKFK